MIGYEGNCEVPLPPAATFALLSDMANLDRWNPNVANSRLVSGGPLEVGSTYESVIRRGLIRLAATSRLRAIDRPHLVEYEGSIGPFWSVDRLTFEPTAEGTRVTFFNESHPPAWLQPLGPLMNALFQKQAQRAVDGARSYVMSQS